MAKLMQREHVRRLKRICDDYGATLTVHRDNGAHVIFDVGHFGGSTKLTVTKSSSDRRATKNSEAMLRRILKHGAPPCHKIEPIVAVEEPIAEVKLVEPPNTEEPPMNDLTQMIAKQIEGQVQSLVRERLTAVIGDLDAMLEERLHAYEMVMDMDRKIAAKLKEIRVSDGAEVKVPSIPEPAPAPVLAPTAKPLTLEEALVACARENNGRLYTRALRKRLFDEGFIQYDDARGAKAISSCLQQNKQIFKKGDGYGIWELINVETPGDVVADRDRKSGQA